MFIIEGHKENQKWISAVIKREKKAKDFYKRIPEEAKVYHKFYEIEQAKYPVYVLENDSGFYFVTKEVFHKTLADINSSYYSFLEIVEDLIPDTPGWEV